MSLRNLNLKGGFEPKVLEALKRRKDGYKFKLEYEPEKFPYIIERTYTPDFKIHRKDGTIIYIEAKGYFRDADQKKMRSIKTQRPDLDIRFVFMTDNRIKKGSKMRYSDWCNKYGFEFCIGLENLPDEWFE